MTLDVWLVERLAAELRESMVGARIQNAAGDASGLRLDCYRRGGALTMRATFDADGPLLAVHRTADAGNENVAGGWAGGVAPLLRGCSVESVQAVPNDRIILVDVVSRSAFGVPARHRLTFELEPNKANILVLRFTEDARWHILAAAKEIESSTGARSIVVGETYELPPPRRSRLDEAQFSAAVASAVDREPRALTRLLSEYDPTCSPPLARETIERANDAEDGRPLGLRLLEAWVRLRDDVNLAAADVMSPVYAWRKADGGFATVHLVRLSWPPGTGESVSALNDVCVQQQIAGDRKRRAPAAAALRKRLTTMIDRCDAEMDALRAAERRGAQADAFRIAGESIYTYLADIPERAESFVTPEGLRVELDPLLSAKENAAAYFRRFKKARSGLPRVAARLVTLSGNRTYWEALLWELERAQSASVEELSAVCDEIADAIGSRKTTAKRSARRRTAPAHELPGGALAHVGRSPKDNERVTFSVGAPNDLWFHARGIPGAHVILKLSNPRDRATDEQILAAAALAAGQSRAADAQKVEVDYAQRKHVRKQGGGKVGLVWYTDFKTVLVQPRKL